MWILFAVLSACLLGFYDVFKKKSLSSNAVIPVLFINTVICSIFFLPAILGSSAGIISETDKFYIPSGKLPAHLYVLGKAVLVLSSWICGYFSIKHLPITIVGPINATRPVMVMIGAMLIFGEKLNLWQWLGVLIAVFAVFMLSSSGKKEGINFGHNKWIVLLFTGALFGALSGLYDKFLIASPTDGGIGLNRYFVQGWYNVYQAIIMSVFLLLRTTGHFGHLDKFQWRWSIPLISIFLTAADIAYLYALSKPGALIAIVSMVRRGSVIVSFTFGAMVFHEKNLKGKFIDLIMVVASMVCLMIGTLYA